MAACLLAGLAGMAGEAWAQSRAAGDYLFLIDKKALIKNGAFVDGNVAVNRIGGNLRIGKGAVLALGTDAVGDRTRLNTGAQVFDLFTNIFKYNPDRVVIAGTLVRPVAAPIFFSEPLVVPDPFAPQNFPPVFPIACGGPSVFGEIDQAIALPPDSYSVVKIARGGLLSLSAGTYHFCDLAANGADVLVNGPVTINIQRNLLLGKGSTLVPLGQLSANDVQINVMGRSVRIGFDSNVSARLFAPSAALRLGTQAVVKGQFIAQQLKSDPFFEASPPKEPPTCGNHTLNSGETCDPPNAPQPPNQNLCRADCTFCGDGLVQAGEQCDDANTNNDDTCRNNCTTAPPPSCGNGVLDAGETCDPPGSDPPPAGGNLCRTNCTYCGDGQVQAGEQCDDANTNDGDACRNDCTLPPAPTCGNGTVDAGETCDPPGGDPPPAGGNLCRANCTYCGDGQVQAGEQCDDANGNDGDACRNDCTLNQPPTCGNGTLDSGETCDPPGTDPPPPGGNLCRTTCTYCGDGTVNDGEQCDDGNGNDDDACRNNCTLPPPAPFCGDGAINQTSETCDPPGADPPPAGGNLCRANCTYCGDGQVQTGEQCDDANTSNDDACRNDCTLPPPAQCLIDVEKTASPTEVTGGTPPPNCLGKVTALVFRYTGKGCSATTNFQSGNVICSGGANFAEPVRIVVHDRKTTSRIYGDTSGVLVGGTAGGTAAAAGVSTFGANTRIVIRNDAGTIIEDVQIHTSCSKPLDLGDQFGSLELVGITTTNGGEQTLGQTVTYTYEVFNRGTATLTNITLLDDKLGAVPGTPIASLAAGASVTRTATAVIGATTTNTVTASGSLAGGATCQDTDSATVTRVEPPPPSAQCESGKKPSAITLRYTGEGCSATTNLQGGKAVCTGGANFTQPVRILIRDKNDGTLVWGDQSGVSIDGLVSGAAANERRGEFKGDIVVRIFSEAGAVIEENTIHTSCSQPLAVGDKFGSLAVTSLTLVDAK